MRYALRIRHIAGGILTDLTEASRRSVSWERDGESLTVCDTAEEADRLRMLAWLSDLMGRMDRRAMRDLTRRLISLRGTSCLAELVAPKSVWRQWRDEGILSPGRLASLWLWRREVEVSCRRWSPYLAPRS